MSSSTPLKRTLQIYILPTLHNKFVFHSRFLKPTNKFERHATIIAFISRKWRYSVSDEFSYYWHRFGASMIAKRQLALAGISEPESDREIGKLDFKTRVGLSLYQFGNRVTTRRAADEYFLKTINTAATNIEFIYPPGLDLRAAKDQLANWINKSATHRNKLLLWSLIFPLDFQIAKIHLPAANIFFVYNCFRVASHFRAMQGARLLREFFDGSESSAGEVMGTNIVDSETASSEGRRNKIVWNESKEFGELLKRAIKSVEEEDAEYVRKSAQYSASWKWESSGGDLHDDVLFKLEKDLKLAELSRTYRRARMQYFVQNGNDI
ncbi:hypothetical protein HK098_004346 [Nowakowskiella sp. JEL0407]|nr:hypothetical protein HK098_004346 [Nowakowskiella sp. JEL0407]